MTKCHKSSFLYYVLLFSPVGINRHIGIGVQLQVLCSGLSVQFGAHKAEEFGELGKLLFVPTRFEPNADIVLASKFYPSFCLWIW